MTIIWKIIFYIYHFQCSPFLRVYLGFHLGRFLSSSRASFSISWSVCLLLMNSFKFCAWKSNVFTPLWLLLGFFSLQLALRILIWCAFVWFSSCFLCLEFVEFWGLLFFMKFGKISIVISSNFFCCPPPHFSFPISSYLYVRLLEVASQLKNAPSILKNDYFSSVCFTLGSFSSWA